MLFSQFNRLQDTFRHIDFFQTFGRLQSSIRNMLNTGFKNLDFSERVGDDRTNFRRYVRLVSGVIA